MGIGDWGLGIGDWGLGIGDWDKFVGCVRSEENWKSPDITGTDAPYGLGEDLR
ncbi:MAG: hypothetical protein ACSI46_13765 [Gloeotrichia echinulata DVL01]|nr:hypothetical protein [Gloeotrichia echinulata DEX184]